MYKKQIKYVKWDNLYIGEEPTWISSCRVKKGWSVAVHMPFSVRRTDLIWPRNKSPTGVLQIVAKRVNVPLFVGPITCHSSGSSTLPFSIGLSIPFCTSLETGFTSWKDYIILVSINRIVSLKSAHSSLNHK